MIYVIIKQNLEQPNFVGRPITPTESLVWCWYDRLSVEHLILRTDQSIKRLAGIEINLHDSNDEFIGDESG